MHTSNVFSKVDVKEASWHLELDSESSVLTNDNPIGSISVGQTDVWSSSELSQKRVNEALEGLTDVICVADDILVTGCGDTTAMAERDHDENGKKLKQRCKD